MTQPQPRPTPRRPSGRIDLQVPNAMDKTLQEPDAGRLSAVAPRDSHQATRAEQAECRAERDKGFGAGDGSRTRDIQLGRLTLYRLSYSRP